MGARAFLSFQKLDKLHGYPVRDSRRKIAPVYSSEKRSNFSFFVVKIPSVVSTVYSTVFPVSIDWVFQLERKHVVCV